MGAIIKHYDFQTTIHRILAADIDIALICHKGPNIEIAYGEILQAMTDSADMKDRGIESVARIMRLKNKYLPH